LTNYVLSIDPGYSTGIALLSYGEDSPAALVKAWQFTHGLRALNQWIHKHWRDSGWDHYNDAPEYKHLTVRDPYLWLSAEPTENPADYDAPWHPAQLTVIAEKFTPRPNDKFGLTLKSVEPLRCEGVLVDRGLLPDYDPEAKVKPKEWRQPKDQYLVGGKDLVDKKKRQHAFLKDTGFYVTNKDFPDSPAKDQADDARSAIGHGINYIARGVKHKPTFEMMSEWSETHG
jgi:hypothetical protein